MIFKKKNKTVNPEISAWSKDLLENPVFTYVIDNIKEEIVNDWITSHKGAVEERENLYRMYSVLLLLETKLNQYIMSDELDKKISEIRRKERL